MKIYNKKELKKRRQKLRRNQTLEEKKIWNILRNKNILGVKFYRQYSIDYYIADFYSPKIKLVIEIDGEQHNTKNAKEYDEVRTEMFNSLEIEVIRFTNKEVNNDFENVIDEICYEIKKRI